MSSAMELSNEILEKIGSYVKRNLAVWIQETGAPPFQTDPALLERAVRIEDELRVQRELLDRSFAMAESRFDQADRRLEQQREEMAARFAHTDRSLSVLTVMLDVIGVVVTAMGIVVTVSAFV